MNLLNVFWGMFAFFSGFLVTMLLWLFGIPMMGALVTEGTVMYYTGYIAIILATFVFLIIIPIMTAISDEDGGIFKKLVGR